MIRILSIACVLLYVCCNNSSENDNSNSRKLTLKDSDRLKAESGNATISDEKIPHNISYNLDKADEVYELPNNLLEISGLVILNDGRIGCVQDEAGIIYYFDPATKQIKDKLNFAGAGDFEGITKAGNTLYVTESNGIIHKLENFQSGKVTDKIIRTPFKTANNIEGIAADEKNGRILIVPKGKDLTETTGKSVYALNIASEKFRSEPLFSFEMEGSVKSSGKGKKKAKKINEAQPSDIDIHPITSDIYIISAANQMLWTFSPDGTLKASAKLNKNIFIQPEGLAFDDAGNLFISNEGKNGKATILKFAYAKNLQ